MTKEIVMSHREMRRSHQELTSDDTLEILKTGKVAVVAVSGDNGYPYAVPVNYVYDSGNIYFHSAPQGHKIDAIARNSKCSVCIVDKDGIIPAEFTSYFRSVIAFGIAEVVSDTGIKIEVIKRLCEKYCPGFDPAEEIYKSLSRVAIIRIRIEHATGKQAIELTRQ